MGSITPQACRPHIAAAVATVAALCPVPLARAAAPPTLPRHQQQPLVVRVDDGGFHWGDAGIGAVAGIGAALVLSGAFVLARQRDRVLSQPPQHKERRR
jgi:hypothetical protein